MWGMNTQEGNQKVTAIAVELAGKPAAQAVIQKEVEKRLGDLAKDERYVEAKNADVRDRVVDYVSYSFV
jgi:hypothetical protein